ncbi:MAG: hypothetical protein WCK90_00345 [archaeon]
METWEERLAKGKVLLSRIKKNLPSLEERLAFCEKLNGEEDMVYRFYHESNKVYNIQDDTKGVYELLEKISPHEKKKIRDKRFLRIYKAGTTGRKFKLEDNLRWDEITRPMLEAFFHAKYFLKMAVKYGKELKRPPKYMPYGWAALLELYEIR